MDTGPDSMDRASVEGGGRGHVAWVAGLAVLVVEGSGIEEAVEDPEQPVSTSVSNDRRTITPT